MDTLLQDVRYGCRLLARDRGFSLTAIATLAICLGANVAIFGVVHAVLLRPLPVPEPDRIMFMYNDYPNAGVEGSSTGVPDYFDRLREVDVFEEQSLYDLRGRTIGGQGDPERITALEVTPSFFRLLRVAPHRGRVFTDGEGEIGNERKVILSHALWERLYDSDEGVVGRDLRVDGVPYTIVGIMPSGFQIVSPEVQLWAPLAFTPEERSDDARHNNSWQMIGRLKPGATLAQAQSQVDALNRRNLDRFPHFREVLTNAGFRTVIVPFQEYTIRRVRDTLYLLWSGVGFVLLIGAVNVANLALVRSTSRMKELATRHALGASQWRMSRQMVTEMTLLTVVAGGLGLAVGRLLLEGLQTLGLDELPRSTEIALDGTVMVFGLALSLVVGILVGAIPVVRILRANLGLLVREEGRSGTASRGTWLMRRALVTAQVALALVLLVGAGLLLASFQQVLAVDPGFRSNNVLTGTVSPPAARYADDPALSAFYKRLLDEVRSLPGVVAAGATSSIPFGGNYSDSVIFAEGYEMRPGESLISPNQLAVTPGYFEAMGIALHGGRFFADSDHETAPLVAIVDQTLARRFWGDADPVGRRLIRIESVEDLPTPGPKAPRLTVVGVVADVKLQDLANGGGRVGAYYFPYAQSVRRTMTLAARTAGAPAALADDIQRRIRSIDADLPFYQPRTMDERLRTSLVSRRTPLVLALSFGAIALLLSAIGIYGVLAYQVAQRTREIGIRMALGSETRQIFSMVLREGMTISAIGLGLGFAGALALGRTLESQLFGVAPTDPLVLGVVGLALGAVAIVACIGPARRATRIDPVIALGQE